MGRVFQIALRGKGKILSPQCSEMINFAGQFRELLFTGGWRNEPVVGEGGGTLVGGFGGESTRGWEYFLVRGG